MATYIGADTRVLDLHGRTAVPGFIEGHGHFTGIGNAMQVLDLMHVTGDRHFYEIRPRAFHIHLVCMSCGSVEEPGGPFWQELQRRVHRETGFKPQAARLEMGGTCDLCQKKKSKGGKK